MQADDGLFQESWQLTSSPHSARWIGTLGGGPEVSDDGTNEYVYDPSAKVIYSRPSRQPLQLSGPLSQLRADLASGRARLVGSTTIAGARVYEVRLRHGYVGYLDPRSYRPLYIDSPTRDGLVRMRVVALEYLPKTAETVRLLSLSAQHPGVPVEVNPAAWGGK